MKNSWSLEKIDWQFANPPAGISDPRNSNEWIYYGRRDLVRAVNKFYGGWTLYLLKKGFNPSRRSWTPTIISQTFHNPPTGVLNPRIRSDWDRAGYVQMTVAIKRLYGGWRDFLLSQNLTPLTLTEACDERRRWTREKILQTFQNPPSAVKDKRNCKQWKDAGYDGMICAIYKIYGSWPKFVLSQEILPLETRWTRERIIQTFHNPPKTVREKRNYLHWRRAGFGGMIKSIYGFWGSWHKFLYDQRCHKIKKGRKFWTTEKILMTYFNPPASVENPRSIDCWRRAGFNGMIKAVYRKFGSWRGFLANLTRRGKIRLKYLNYGQLVDIFSNPPVEIKDARSSSQWRSAGYENFLISAERICGSWHKFLYSLNIEPKLYWGGGSRVSKERIIEQFNNPPSGVKDRRNSTQWKRAGFFWMLNGVYTIYGGWRKFLISRGLEPLKLGGPPQLRWTKEKIIEQFNNPPPRVKDRCNSAQWQKVGFEPMLKMIRKLFGSWSQFLLSQNLVGIGKENYKPWQGRYTDWQIIRRIAPELFLDDKKSYYKRLREEQLLQLFAEVRNGNVAAKEILIEINRPLVKYVLSKLINKYGLVLGDQEREILESIVTYSQKSSLRTTGLERAIELYQPEKGKFSNYAFYWIKQGIDRGIKVISKERLKLDSPISAKDDRTIKDVVSSHESIEEGILRKSDWEIIKSKVDKLIISERNKQIIIRRLSGEKLNNIGRSFNLSRERIRQIVKKYRPQIINNP